MQPAGKSGSPEVCVAKFSCYFCPWYDGTLTLGGRYCCTVSFNLTNHWFTMSIKMVVANVFVSQAISNRVFPSTFVWFDLDKLPYAATEVPFGDTMPKTIDAGSTVELEGMFPEVFDNRCLNTICFSWFNMIFDNSFADDWLNYGVFWAYIILCSCSCWCCFGKKVSEL